VNALAYNQLVDTYADNVYRFALKHLKNEMDAKDIVQSTYLKMWDKHESVELAKGKSYLFTTAYHLILDFLKTGKRFQGEEAIIEVQNEDNPSDFDLSETLNWALDKLPEIQKTVVLLRDYEGYSYDEIAEIAGISESQVKVYIFRARKTLKSILIEKELVV
jgi:RNA polymerase sigma factor (sigma-70 family)